MGRPLRVPEDYRAFATRLARYGTRTPAARERLTYDQTATAVTYRSDSSEGPTAGTETMDPLAFLAQVLVHIPDQGLVTTRNDDGYANRPRGMPGKAEPAAADAPPPSVPAPRLALTEAIRRWRDGTAPTVTQRWRDRRSRRTFEKSSTDPDCHSYPDAQQFGEGPVPFPDHWDHLGVVPEELESRSGRSSRLHDRIPFRKEAGNWVKRRLSP
ncbi:MAG: transposase [Gemmatimonas sp.]|uniref:transposase n=1 Tax=Gemmatimonas sp. TaxID=1962908 RepID=UPI00391F1B46|nr:transposase [Gemmatimonadota bacterium]